MGVKRSNENGGHKPSDDMKTVVKGKTGSKTAEAVQIPKPASKDKSGSSK